MKTQGNLKSGMRTLAAAVALPFLAACGMNDHESMSLPSSVPISTVDYDAVYVVNGGDNTITVINASTNEVSGTIVLKNASWPHHLYLSPDGTKMALAVPGTDLSMGHGGGGGGHGGHDGMIIGAVMLMDAATGATLASRYLNVMNHNAVFSPDGSEIWTSQMAMPGMVKVLHGSTLKTMRMHDVGDMPAEITFSPNGRHVFAACGMSNDVVVLDAATGAVVKTIPVGANPVGAWPAANGRMYVDNEDGKSLSVIDTASLEVVLTYDLGFTPAMVALGPDGALWVTDDDNGKVAFYSPDADSALGELATGAGAHAIAFSADGITAYVSNQGAGTVSVIAVPSRTVVKNIAVGSKPNGLVFRARPQVPAKLSAADDASRYEETK